MMSPTILRLCLPIPFLAWFFLTASAPGIVSGDAGELTTAAFHLGSAHPPGYPLYVLLGKLFIFLPFGTPAFRLTFLSCLALASSYPLLAGALERLLKSILPDRHAVWTAAATTFFTVTGPLVFAQSNGPEVYALHFFLSALLLFLATRSDSASFNLSFLVLGLALANHHLVLFAVPALMAAWWGRLKRPKLLLAGSAVLLLGLSVYLVLPLRAHLDPVAHWGDADNLARFIRHLTRAQYERLPSASGLLLGVENIGHYVSVFIRETWVFGLLAALAFLSAGLRKPLRPHWIATGCLLFLLPLLLRVEKNPSDYYHIDAFFPPAFLWAAPLVASGAAALLASVKSRAARGAIAVLLVMIALSRAFVSWRDTNGSGNLVAESMGRNYLLTLPRQAALHSFGDTSTFSLFYLQKVVQLRPDALITDRSGGTFGNAYGLTHPPSRDTYQTMTAAEKNKERERSSPAAFYTESAGVPGRSLEPCGLLYLADRKPDPQAEERLWRCYREPEVHPRDEFLTREEACFFHLFRGRWLLKRGQEAGARDAFSKVTVFASDNSQQLSSLGWLYMRQGWQAEADELYARILRFAPRNIDAMFLRGVLCANRGLGQEAERRLLLCLKWKPARSDIRNNLASLYVSEGRTDDAVSQLEYILRTNPSYSDAYRILGLALWSVDRPRAKSLLRNYLALDPGTPNRAALEKALR